MNSTSPDSSCTLSTSGTVIKVPIGPKCKVVYEISTAATSKDLRLPYIVSVEGKVLPEFATRPGVLGVSRKIELTVDAGSRVALFLNSDVHPSHRCQPVYEVQVNTKDVYVTIEEKTGRNIGHLHPVVGMPVCRPSATPGQQVEAYSAYLTGDIWMLISHAYTEAEANALMPSDTAPVIRAAVQDIFRGLPKPRLVVDFPAGDAGPRQTLTVHFSEEMQGNVRSNTTNCSWLTGILPRTHPLAYTALLSEARASGVTEVRVTSAWRPCLGSIAHRAGLGLDINYAEGNGATVPLNRASLTKPGAAKNGNVSREEEEKYAAYVKARDDTKAVGMESQRKLVQLKKSGDPDEKQRLAQEFYVLTAKHEACKKAEAGAASAWEKAMKQHEPPLMDTLRQKLGKNPAVKQLFDPWYMDANARDANPADANAQFTPNERLHNNHLHITVLEPQISG